MIFFEDRGVQWPKLDSGFGPLRSASFPGGAPALPELFQQAPIHPAAVAATLCLMRLEDCTFHEA